MYKCTAPAECALECNVDQPSIKNCINGGTKEWTRNGEICAYLSEITPSDMDIKDYWDFRAKENPGGVTTNDIHLRDLEINIIISEIRKTTQGGSILDIGCGDGLTTLEVAAQFPECHITGIDFSDRMVELANKNLALKKELNDRVRFTVGDITNLHEIFKGWKFDVIISNRCLINMRSTKVQYEVLESISNQITEGGYFIATENFVEGQEAMNNARKSMGLSEIPVQWHNQYFTEPEFKHHARKQFRSVEIIDFSSSYYFATRVVYAKMCQMRGEKPDYDHEIHRLATRLPPTGKFSPVKLVVMKKTGGKEPLRAQQERP